MRQPAAPPEGKQALAQIALRARVVAARPTSSNNDVISVLGHNESSREVVID